MTLYVAADLPAADVLRKEGLDVRSGKPAEETLRVLILNLMPTKEATELQLLRLLGRADFPVQVDFLQVTSRESKHVSKTHLDKYYYTFFDILDRHYDGFVITGAPVEQLPFEEVDYFEELAAILTWSESYVASRFFICWGAQFALNHYYGVEKLPLGEKLFGIYPYQNLVPAHPYLRNFPTVYDVPQSRHTKVDADQVTACSDLTILTAHPENGPDIVISKSTRDLFVFGHLEYDCETLQKEYVRDRKKGAPITLPENYYPDDNPDKKPIHSWQGVAQLLWRNWVRELYQHSYSVSSR